jgi:hypothetical protein
MNDKKFRISIEYSSTGSSFSSSNIDVDSYEEMLQYLRYEGIRKFSLAYTSIIDDAPSFKETRLSIETFTKEHFKWLTQINKNEHRLLKVDFKEQVAQSDWQVYEGIRKTINRFRERPLFYFSEVDIHSYLHHDILQGNSSMFYQNISSNHPISLVHLEYPTNFRYQKDELLTGIKISGLKETNSIKSDKGGRGNYDLAVLNEKFIHDVDKKYSGLEEKIKHIMNKDISYSRERIENRKYNRDVVDGKHANQFQREVQFAFEMKYFHPFNARNESVIQEIVKDNEKLKLALIFSNYYIKPINLIFCSSSSKERRDQEKPIIDRVKDYVLNGVTEISIENNKVRRQIPNGVLNIFIESYIDGSEKKTNKPIAFCHGAKYWVKDLCWKLNVELNETYNDKFI